MGPIRAILYERGITSTWLARQLGIPLTTLSRIDSGRASLSEARLGAVLDRAAAILGVEPAALRHPTRRSGGASGRAASEPVAAARPAPDDRRGRVAEYLRAALAERGLSQSRLAMLAGLHPAIVGRYLKAQTTPNLTSCYRLAEALGREPWPLLDLAGHLPPEAVARGGPAMAGPDLVGSAVAEFRALIEPLDPPAIAAVLKVARTVVETLRR